MGPEKYWCKKNSEHLLPTIKLVYTRHIWRSRKEWDISANPVSLLTNRNTEVCPFIRNKANIVICDAKNVINYSLPILWLSILTSSSALASSQNILKCFLSVFIICQHYIPSKMVPRKTTSLARGCSPVASLQLFCGFFVGRPTSSRWWRPTSNFLAVFPPRRHNPPPLSIHSADHLLFVPRDLFVKPYSHTPWLVDMQLFFRKFSLKPNWFIKYIVTESLWALWAPTSSWRSFGRLWALGPSVC